MACSKLDISEKLAGKVISGHGQTVLVCEYVQSYMWVKWKAI
jgi:hypothetical protein